MAGLVVCVEECVGDVVRLDSDGRTVREWKKVESRISGFRRLRWSRRAERLNLVIVGVG